MEPQMTQYPEIDQQQLQTADSGSDLYDPNVDPTAQQDPGYETEADYMADQSQLPMSQNSSSLSAETMKILHLFDLAQDLYDYGNILGDNLKEIDKSALDKRVFGHIRQIEQRLEEFQQKTRDFIVEVFYKETYEKNLYIYMSLRHEILTMIKFLRELLRLHVVDEGK